MSSSAAFESLHPKVREWIWNVAGWPSLYEIQEEAIPPISAGNRDVLIGAPTAGGKTEAAFLPIASTLAGPREGDQAGPEPENAAGLGVVCVSPLKALINDQARRLESLFSAVDLPVHRWHGDVDSGRKKKLLRRPSGLLLITPESLEAMFVLRGPRVRGLFSQTKYLVIDELHAFLGTERGQQLQSLLARVEDAAERKIPRIALSATLGDMDMAASFLRNASAADVAQITSSRGGQEVQVQIRTYLEDRFAPESAQDEEPEAASRSQHSSPPEHGELGHSGSPRLTGDLFDLYRKGHHLVFANRRAEIEVFSDRLRGLCEAHRLPNVFWPHHGSLSSELRSDAEDALRDQERSATILATTTLELGIDVGEVESVGQIGPPSSVAGLRQRLGRSGRRDKPAQIRIFLQETVPIPTTPPHERLHLDLVQSVAAVRLLAESWCEPPSLGALHLSTLVQQILSVLAERGGIFADEAYRLLCRDGAFGKVTPEQFARVLRSLGHHQLLRQLHNGELTLDLEGERLVNQYDFFAAFQSSEEYRVVWKTKTLGSLPILFPLLPGTYLLFGGRRWRIEDVDEDRKVVYLAPAPGGRAPTFASAPASVHDRVREEMRLVLETNTPPTFADESSRQTLQNARRTYAELELAKTRILSWNRLSLLFPWRGDRVMNTILCLLRSLDLEVGLESAVVRVDNVTPNEVRERIHSLLRSDLPDPRDLAERVPNKLVEKHHRFLSEELLVADYASGQLDLEGAVAALRELCD